jgi:hypothetical protein
MANTLQDRTLIGKLAGYDAICKDVVYHNFFYTCLYNRFKAFERQHGPSKPSKSLKADSIVLAELISYIEVFNDGKTVFKLAELVNMFSRRLEELVGSSTKVNSTRLKEKLLKAIPELVTSKATYGVVLSYSVNIGDVLLSACKQNSDDDAIILMQSAQIVRKEILQLEYKFSNSLTDDKYDQYPRSLTALNEMILHGTSIDPDHPREVSSAALSITQLMIFNSVKRERKEKKSGSTRHSSLHETPLPLYTPGHSTVPGGQGCVSTKAKTRTLCGQQDNVDHNPSSTTSQSSFHGTALSLICHVTPDNQGTERGIQEENATVLHQRRIAELPQYYTDVPPIHLFNDTPKPPSVFSSKVKVANLEADAQDIGWLDRVSELVHKEKLDQTDYISWSGYHADIQT